MSWHVLIPFLKASDCSDGLSSIILLHATLDQSFSEKVVESCLYIRWPAQLCRSPAGPHNRGFDFNVNHATNLTSKIKILQLQVVGKQSLLVSLVPKSPLGPWSWLYTLISSHLLLLESNRRGGC